MFKDIGIYGNVRVRDAGISQENQQRAKCLTAPSKVFKQNQRNEMTEIEIKISADCVEAKKDRKCNEDHAMINSICVSASLETSEENVGQCELKHFAKLKAPQLRAFILARHQE